MTLPIFIAGILIFLSATKPVHAYLDPGTGSYIFQLLVAGLLGSTFFLKSAVRKVKKIISDRKTGSQDNGDE